MTGAYPDEEIRDITPDYFRVLETPLLKGRFFTEADTADSPPVVIVNQAFVKKYFRDGEALGKRISRDDTNPKWATIVGVVADIKHRGLDTEAQPEYYSAAHAGTRPGDGTGGAQCAGRAHAGPHCSGRIAQH